MVLWGCGEEGEGMIENKCPYCKNKGKNIYLKRTSPVVQYGCRICEAKIKIMRGNGMSEQDIRKVIQEK